MIRADEVKAGMNDRQKFRAYRAERIAYGFDVPTFRSWFCFLGKPCNVHENWKPGCNFLPRMSKPRPDWYPRRVHNWQW